MREGGHGELSNRSREEDIPESNKEVKELIAQGRGAGSSGSNSSTINALVLSFPQREYSHECDLGVRGPTQNDTHFGKAVTTAGDVNGDGYDYDDIIVGAPSYDALGNPANDNGKVFAYYGSPTGTGGTENWSVTGGVGSQLGASLASGTYFARLQIPGTGQTRRITLMR